jgi:glycosyltransferase involved in cell wall biosynthesis
LKLSIVIPVYNEEDLVLQVLEKLEKVDYPDFLEGREYIVVDDCSSDKTKEKVADWVKKNWESNCTIYSHQINQGKGAAVRTGIGLSKGDTILIQDADLELSPDDIPLMLQSMRDLRIEFVNGSRYMPGIIRPLYSYRRYYLNKLFTRIASVLINVRLTDLACGYKLFTKRIFEGIELTENRFGFEAELLIKVARKKMTLIAEVPVHYFPRNVGEGKKIRNIDGLRILWVIIKYGLFRMK